MQKRGQETFGMSFSVIFSIILIIVIVGVAFYAISHFVGIKNCADAGLFYSDLQNEIDKAWNADQFKNVFKAALPSEIESVCFGNFNKSAADGFSEKLKSDISEGNCDDNGGMANVFMYPPQKSCDIKLCSNTLKHVKVDKFFCINAGDGKLSVKLENKASKEGVFVVLSAK